MSRIIMTLFFILGFIFSSSFAQGANVSSQMKEISGEVSGIAKNFIAVIYQQDASTGQESEIALDIAKDASVVHKKTLDQISVGDTVTVQYEEFSEQTPEGLRQSRKAKVITFLRAAEKKPETVETEQLDEEALLFKGIKSE